MDQTEIIILRGKAAKELLANEAFMAVSNELVNGYLAQLVQTKAEEKTVRESLYAHVRAVQDIVGLLNNWAAAGEQAQAKLDAENEEDEE